MLKKHRIVCAGGIVLLFLLFIFFFLQTVSAAAPERQQDEKLWQLLSMPGHVVLLRHAVAPGVGDPPQFSLDDCRTQRNLSDSGRLQAKEIGARFRSQGIDRARIYTSQWCRCRETAALLGLGEVKELALLNSFFQNAEGADEQTAGVRRWLSELEYRGALILVTHQVNITALTGVYPSSGEMVVGRREKSGKIVVVGTLALQ